MLDYVPTYDVAHIFPFPREIRFLEVVLLAFCYLQLLSIRSTTINDVTRSVLVFVLVSVGGIIGVGIERTTIQEVYIRLAPFLVYICAAKLGVEEEDLKKVLKRFSWVLGISIGMAVAYQIPYYGYYEDNVHGFFSDAHVFANFLSVFSIVLIWYYSKNRTLSALLLSILLLALSVYPKNEKVLVLTIMICATIILFTFHGKLTWAKGIAVGTTILALGLFSLKSLETYLMDESGLRISQVLDLGLEVGPISAWPIAWNETTTSMKNFLFGLGPGQYGWIAAGSAVASGAGSPIAQQFDLEFSNDSPINAGFLFRTNTWSSLLAEFGVVGFISFWVSLLLISWKVFRSHPINGFQRSMKSAYFAISTIVIFQGFFTPYSNWSESVLTFPMMYIAAFFTRPMTLTKKIGASSQATRCAT